MSRWSFGIDGDKRVFCWPITRTKHHPLCLLNLGYIHMNHILLFKLVKADSLRYKKTFSQCFPVPDTHVLLEGILIIWQIKKNTSNDDKYLSRFINFISEPFRPQFHFAHIHIVMEKYLWCWISSLVIVNYLHIGSSKYIKNTKKKTLKSTRFVYSIEIILVMKNN